MEMVTVKRNGIFISFPKLQTRNEETRDDVIAGTLVITTARGKKAAQAIKPNMARKVNTGYIQQKARSIVKIKIGKRCIRCGEECWRSDVSYCWDCYKYENFESK